VVASRFIETGFEFLDLMDSSIWSGLGRRFVQEVVPSGSDDRVLIRETRFRPDGKSLDGIISHLTSKCGGNVHDNGVVTASSSSISGFHRPKNALDLQNRNSCFCSDNVADSWICLDFKNMEVTPTHYSILSYQGQANQQHHPKSWCLEVSGDGRAWKEVDRREGNNEVNGSNLIGTFEVSNQIKSRFIRLRQTGKNHYNNDRLLMCGLEIFGILHER
jgi:hypothetical protein